MTIKTDYYNDPEHNYLKYWGGREYEHDSEVMAIKSLLKDKRFDKAIDIGGGYGRLCITLREFADHVTLTEPSSQQLELAEEFLSGTTGIDTVQAGASKLPYNDNSVDLATMVRVLHHIPEPAAEFEEIKRVLKKDGLALFEFANAANFKNKLRYFVKRIKLPTTPLDLRSNPDDIPFVNHFPATIRKQLEQVGFEVVDTRTVSNLRSAFIKKFVPHNIMIKVESAMQKSLAKAEFGPSIMYLVRKK
jgi:ubiquinone/menaquinone biosynthesis C-methylase UbiE